MYCQQMEIEDLCNQLRQERQDHQHRIKQVREAAVGMLAFYRREAELAKCQRDELVKVLEEIGNTACGEASHQYVALAALAKLGAGKTANKDGYVEIASFTLNGTKADLMNAAKLGADKEEV